MRYMRDALGDIAAMAYNEVIREPVMIVADVAGGLIADLGVKCVWQSQTEAFDIRVIDADAHFYICLHCGCCACSRTKE